MSNSEPKKKDCTTCGNNYSVDHYIDTKRCRTCNFNYINWKSEEVSGREKLSNLEKGIKAENMIADKLRYRNREFEQNHTWGIDIILNGKNKRIKIEVKSSRLFVKNKNGKNRIRSGKFSIQLTDLERPIDYFAFVVYKLNEKVDTYWVRGEVIRKHFSTRKRKNNLGLGIPTLLTRIPKVDFSEVIEL